MDTPDRQPLPPGSPEQQPPEEIRPDSPPVAPEVLVEGLEEAIQERHDPYAALRDPNYRFYASGFLVSATGMGMLSTGLAWEVYERTQDPLMLGYVGLARAVPVILCALPAGQAADIFNRKRVLIATQSGFAVVALVLAAVSWAHAPVWMTFVLISLSGCVRSFNGPSRNALVPLIVPPAVFQNAVTWNSGVFQLSAVGGPMLAGVLIAVTGAAWPVYLATAAACAAFAMSASMLRPRPQDLTRGNFTLASMTAGAGHLWKEKPVLAAIALDMFAVLLGGATALMPIYAKDILNVGPTGLGALRAAPYIGAFLMALILAHRAPFKRAGPALLLSVAGFGLATVVFGLSTWFPLSMAVLVLLGALDNISVVIRHVLVQVRTPDALRGRVSAVNSVFIESSNELGAFESGLVAKLFGPVLSVVSGGIGTMVVVAGIAWKWPQVRRLGKLEELKPEPPVCGRCGYDLSGLPEPGCPECGLLREGAAKSPRPGAAAGATGM